MGVRGGRGRSSGVGIYQRGNLVRRWTAGRLPPLVPLSLLSIPLLPPLPLLVTLHASLLPHAVLNLVLLAPSSAPYPVSHSVTLPSGLLVLVSALLLLSVLV
jgi:hypothetical protein